VCKKVYCYRAVRTHVTVHCYKIYRTLSKEQTQSWFPLWVQGGPSHRIPDSFRDAMLLLELLTQRVTCTAPPHRYNLSEQIA